MPDSDEVDGELPSMPPPKMQIAVTSKDVLQTTITKTFLEVLSNLGKVEQPNYNI